MEYLRPSIYNYIKIRSMKIQILVLAVLLAIAQSLSPAKETHQKVYTDRRKGCYYGSCWTYCVQDFGYWCYTKNSTSKGDSGRIPCDGDTYDDPDCPYHEVVSGGDNCDSSCSW